MVADRTSRLDHRRRLRRHLDLQSHPMNDWKPLIILTPGDGTEPRPTCDWYSCHHEAGWVWVTEDGFEHERSCHYHLNYKRADQ